MTKSCLHHSSSFYLATLLFPLIQRKHSISQNYAEAPVPLYYLTGGFCVISCQKEYREVLVETAVPFVLKQAMIVPHHVTASLALLFAMETCST